MVGYKRCNPKDARGEGLSIHPSPGRRGVAMLSTKTCYEVRETLD